MNIKVDPETLILYRKTSTYLGYRSLSEFIRVTIYNEVRKHEAYLLLIKEVENE